jgi:hypothetical protein
MQDEMSKFKKSNYWHMCRACELPINPKALIFRTAQV